MPANKPHIGRIERFATSREYQYPKRFSTNFPVADRNRAIHGNRIIRKLQEIRSRFEIDQSADISENLIREDVIYVEFYSPWGYELNFDSLHSESRDPQYQIISVKREKRDSEEGDYRTKAVVILKPGGISHFIKKAERYISENYFRHGEDTGNPIANKLIANIEDIRVATLKSFWTDEPEYPFPDINDSVWWEVWFRKGADAASIPEKVLTNIREIGLEISNTTLSFPEHLVKLVYGTARQLSQSLMLLDNLAELRKPVETADFFTGSELSLAEREEWMHNLVSRVEAELDEGSVLICLLDSGVNNRHPLLAPFLPNERMYTFRRDWGTHDGWKGGGHGTATAGLSLFGDLTSKLTDSEHVRILHGLESFKIIDPGSVNPPELYGYIYEYACSYPFVELPYNRRVFCLTITNNDIRHSGRPSSHSSSIDKIAFGSHLDPRAPQLILISGGNVELERASEFPDKNYRESVKDPAQAYNAMVIGSYTQKDRINTEEWPGYSPLAPRNGMAPSNSTSLLWESKWPNKPDVVFEGVNLARLDEDFNMIDSLQLLTTSKDHRGSIFQTFGDTSGAAALASKMAAELCSAYPGFWPETIRGLMVHSANWTEEMLRSFNWLRESDRNRLIRSVGYGVPNLERALYSADNSVTLISQSVIQPYREEGSTNKYNDYHLYTLPWPVEVLRDDVGFEEVTLKVTLSYFVEPNPGNRNYASHFRYHSHELEFALIRQGESLVEFQRRISSATESDNDVDVKFTGSEWELGRVRSKGSLKKDFFKTTGTELSDRNYLAVFPKNGWYKLRKKLGKGNSVIRYALILSIEASELEVDLYTPVEVQVTTDIQL